ncbi:MAG: hypothetical protein Q9196_000268 [Gyalolechia fulgens]
MAGTPILVPLTPSLYVPGKLASTETVLVDVGTGFYIEKTSTAARKFYSSKVEELGKNLKDLESIVQGKQGNLNVVEDGTRPALVGNDLLRQKMISGSANISQNAKGDGGDG